MKMKVKIRIPLFFLITFFLVGCSENLDDKMFEIIENQNKKNSCKVNFQEIINEPWSLMYIVEEYFTPEEISKAIGFKYLGQMVSDCEYRVIITDHKKILTEFSFYSSRIVFDEDNDSGITQVSAKDTFCAIYNTTIEPHFYSLKKM